MNYDLRLYNDYHYGKITKIGDDYVELVKRLKYLKSNDPQEVAD